MTTFDNTSIDLRILLCREYDTVSAKRTGRTEQRVARFYEMSYYLSGDGFININHVDYPTRTGYVRFVKPGDLVYSIPHFSCLTVNFTLESSNNAIEEQLLSAIGSYFYAGKEAEATFRHLIEHYRGGQVEDHLLQMSILSQLLVSLYRLGRRSIYPEEIQNCIRYMEENFSSHITLKQLGTVSSYSSSHLHRLFLEALGSTPHDYLTDVRIRHAKMLLTTGEMSLDEIATRCGFGSVSHFKTMFKQITGKTPGTFRREMDRYL